MARIEFEEDGPDEIVRIDGVILGRLTGQGANRQMQWRAGQDLDESKILAFDEAFASGGRDRQAAEEALRSSGLG
jgi:hypothetical protein